MSEKGWNTESLIKKLNDWYGLFNIANFTGRFLYSNEVCNGKVSLESGEVRVKSKNVLCALCKLIHGSVPLIWIKWSIIMAPLCLQWIWGKEFLRNARHCYTPTDIKLDEKSSKIDEWSYSFLNEMVSSSLLFYKVFNEEKVTLKNTYNPIPRRCLTHLSQTLLSITKLVKSNSENHHYQWKQCLSKISCILIFNKKRG